MKLGEYTNRLEVADDALTVAVVYRQHQISDKDNVT